MCGRIEYIVTSKGDLEARYGATLVEGYTEQGLTFPHYNVAPTAHTPIVTSEATEEILVGHWGYVPSWAAKEGRKARAVINARAESVLTKPYFRSAITKRRALVPVTGFFEWKRDGTKKTPYRFHMGSDIFSLAALYTTITDEDGTEMPHYAIITTSASELMEPVHNRMPVILSRADEEAWLDEGLEEAGIYDLMRPYDASDLERTEISTLVNNPRNDKPEVIQPVA
jgi:putative SOS response-associated peptidase YedK